MKTITFIDDNVLIKKFIDLPFRLYRNDKKWVPTSKKADKTTLTNNKKLTPENHLKILCLDDGIAVGRALLYKSNNSTAYIGFFESEDNYEILTNIMAVATHWLNDNKISNLYGPLNIDTYHPYRFMTKGFDEELFAGEPYNKPYYPKFFEKYGFTPLKSYYSQVIDKPEIVHKALKPKYEKAISHNYSIRNLEKDRFDEEIDIIYNISNVVFADNFAFTKIDRDEFVNIYKKLKPIMDPNFIFFGLDPEGTPVSFFFSYPEISEILKPKTKIGKFLKLIKYKLGILRTNTLNMKSIGVLPEHRSKSLSSALMYSGYVEGEKRGFTHYNHCLIIEGNYSASYESGAGRKNKEYILYQYNI